MKVSRALSLACVGVLAAAGLAWTPAAAPTAAAATTVRVTPDPAYAAAPFQGWGTSLVWFANATARSSRERSPVVLVRASSTPRVQELSASR